VIDNRRRSAKQQLQTTDLISADGTAWQRSEHTKILSNVCASQTMARILVT
jgi:hypothetical protein